jgi:superfamily II DNA or RNA helicase
MKGLKLREGEDLTEKQQRKAMMNPTLWGRVWDNFEKLNPEHKPSILFGPDVAGSIWFAEQFTANGVRAAHIDADDVWIDGELHPSNREVREQVLADSKSGRIVVLCNRFVLREGIDAPWLQHGIFATVFGSLQSYLQSGGRLLRVAPGKDHCTIQDHGGSYWRHGTLNEDREWSIDLTASMAYGLRAERIRSRKEKEPFRCPNCDRVWTGASQRCSCGYLLEKCKRSRMVAQSDGTLKEMYGDVFRPRRVCTEPDGPELWERMYFRSCTERGAKTFNQAMALFAIENDWRWPDKSWPYMPTDERDYYRLIGDVSRDKLVPKFEEVPL